MLLTSALFVSFSFEALIALADVVGRKIAALGVGDAPGCKLRVQAFVDICRRRHDVVMPSMATGQKYVSMRYGIGWAP